MKRARQFFVILMTGIMIFTGTSLDGFAALSYANESQENAAVQQDEPAGTEDQKASDAETDSDKADSGAVSDAEKKAEQSKDTSDKSEASDSDSDAIASKLQAEFKLSDDSKWKITAVCSRKAGIPEGAELKVEEIDKKDVAEYKKEAAKTLKWEADDEAAYTRFLNITIVSKGKEIEPGADVEFSLESKDFEKNIDEMQVVRFDVNKSDEIVKSEELKCEITKDKELVFKTDEVGAFGLAALKKTDAEKTDSDKTDADDADLVEKTLKAGKVRLEGMMPEDAKATATDASATKAVQKLASDGETALAAYDITIKADGDEFQPDADNPIKVQISNKAIREDSILSVWHIKDDGSKEEVRDFTVENGKVLFDATGFSVYAVLDHENATVKNPRVEFHFIDKNATEHTEGSDVYYEGDPYEFKNKGVADSSTNPVTNYTQTTQILKNGETLELIADPANVSGKNFYGWYVVNPYVISGTTDEYGIGTSDSKLYYTWPGNPKKIAFEKEINITGTDVSIGDPVSWSLNGVNGSGAVDKDGNVHVFLAPLYEKYNFVNFMLYPKDSGQSSNSVMTRRMITLGSESNVDVKISDIRATSKDPTHLIFIGWEYEDENGTPQTKQTVDYTGAEIKDPGRDGTYLTVNLADTSSVDLYPIFIEARWADYYVGESGSGATYVASGFRESWGTDPDNPPAGMSESTDSNIYTSLQTSTRTGYTFDGWYAFAKTDDDGNITNLSTAEDVKVSYITGSKDNYEKHTVTVNTTAVKIANGDGSIAYNGTCCLTVNGNTGTIGSSGSIALFGSGTTAGKLKFYNGLDRLSLTAKWAPGSSKITVVYWTENAQDKGYTAPAAGKEKNDYTASAVKVITTDQLTTNLGSPYASGSKLLLSELQGYQENSVGILDAAYLDEAKAVLEGEEKFYDLNSTLSESSVTIKGDGSTVFNVYFERLTFKLVFHIGRDGYVKNAGQMKADSYPDWDGNWIEYMYRDAAVSALGYTGKGQPSHVGRFSMTYNGGTPGDTSDDVTATSAYTTTRANVKGDYEPGSGENLYVIEAKYGAYIGERWPSPANPNFTWGEETDPGNSGYNKSLYIWTAYYNSLYAGIANRRPTTGGNTDGNNSDINGVYEYMSAELCSNRNGTGLINNAHVHHLVAYFGNKSNNNRYKQYHILYEAKEGTYDPASITPISGTDYENLPLTTWSQENTAGDKSEIIGHQFIEDTTESPKPVISNLAPQYQLSEALDGYDLVYSCYDPAQYPNTANPSQKDYHIYFFYTPKLYKLTFNNVQNSKKEDTYYYTQTLADADKYTDLITVPEGYYFAGWYTNAEGIGEPFEFDTARMPAQNVVLYPVVKAIQYSVKIDPNGGVIDHRKNSSTATYFNAAYGTPIGEYSVECDYIKLTDKELDPSSLNYYTGTKYYYINTQRLGIPSEGDWGLPTDVRNAVYVADADTDGNGTNDIDDYYNWYANKIDTADTTWWTRIQKLSKTDFIDTYAQYPYRKVHQGAEHYSFMGWYQVFDDGSEASMPYNFNDPVKGDMELRAKWRLDGGYYVKYDPCFFADDSGTVTEIVGAVDQWTDPADTAKQLYADQTPTHILHAPTNTTTGWVFRGWRVVKANGTGTYEDPDTHETKTYTKWGPIQLDSGGNPIYYQPGDDFVIDADLVSEIGPDGSIIHMQAYYEKEENTYRRPEVTNLTLDANNSYGGSVDSAAGMLPALAGPGSTTISGNQILFGDIQSNLALHLYKYATTKTHFGETGKKFFKHDNNYLLLGFDKESNPQNPSTGKAFIPKYAADAVVSVQRTDNETLYAMWEPMVYATFVNTTAEDITIDLTGTGTNTVSIVNKVTGEFDREQGATTITVPAKAGDVNGEVKVVFPGAVAGTDKLIATATNDHLGKKMSVSGKFGDTVPYGTGTAASSTPTGVPYGGQATYTGTLQTDQTGIIVTYTEIPDNKVNFDVNGGTWTETNPDYVHVSGDNYSIDEDKIVNNDYHPADPTRSGKVFVGWTTNADIAACTDFSGTDPVTFGTGTSAVTITPAAGSNVLDVVKSDYLWDFSQEPPFDKVLYAVWSEAVTVTFDVVRTGSNLHTWVGPATTDTNAPYVFYRSSDTSGEITYTLAKGERVPKPSDPTTNQTGWHFVAWLLNDQSRRNTTKNPSDPTIVSKAYDFSQPVLTSITLSTSWTTTEPQLFTFTVENCVTGDPDEEFTYTIAVSDEKVYGKIGGKTTNSFGDPDQKWGSVTTTLKNNETYTIQIKVLNSTRWNPNTYSVEIDVIDREDNVIKSGHVIYCDNNRVDSEYSGKNYSSDYKYILTVVQDAKPGYETAVDIQDRNNVDAPPAGYDEISNSARKYTFASIHCGTSSQTSNFSPLTNEYTGKESNSLTIVYTNTAPPIAPTGFTSVFWPFILILAAGFILAAVAVYRRRRNPLEAVAADKADGSEVEVEAFDWTRITFK